MGPMPDRIVPRSTRFSPSDSPPVGRWSPAPLIVLAISLIATAATALLVWINTKQKDHDRFDNLLERAQGQISQRLDMYLAMLRAGRGLFAAAPDVSRRQFHAFVEQFQVAERYPGIQGIGFTRRILAAEKSAFTEHMRKPLAEGGGGFSDFNIWPDHERPEYHSIVYLEPLDRRNLRAIGYDMFTEANRQEAMARARDTGVAAASGKVTLVQEIDENKQAGFLIYVPVYRTEHIPPTVEQRREELIGFVYSPFRAEDLFAGVFRGETKPRVEFEVYDGRSVSPDALLRPGGPHYSPATATFTAVQTIDVAGRPWTIAFATRPEFNVASSRWYTWVVLGVGLVVSVVLFLITLGQVRSARLAEEQRAQHSREIAKALDQRSFELTQIHEELRRTESMAMLGALAAGIAHDLGNLVLPMRTRLDLLKSTSLDDRQREIVDAVARNVEYVSDLAARLRQSIQRTTDQAPSQPPRAARDDERRPAQPLVLSDWCKEHEKFLSSVVTPPRVLECHLPGGLPPVNVDSVGLAQALYNLVQNAEKAMRHSGVGRTISIWARHEKHMVEVNVQDDGPGLPRHVWQRCSDLGFITDRNAPDARRTSALLEYAGPNGGMGLSLVKAFVESAGGRIALASPDQAPRPAAQRAGPTAHAMNSADAPASGPGTRIAIRLPVPHRAAAAEDSPRQSSAIDASAELRIACVDDFSDLLNLVQQLIEREPGMRCVATFSEADPLIAWLSGLDASARPDVVVMDWAMPGLSAAKAIEMIIDRWPRIRVYVFTSHPRHLIREDAARAGASGVIEKGEGVHTLLRAIRPAGDRRQAPSRSSAAAAS